MSVESFNPDILAFAQSIEVSSEAEQHFQRQLEKSGNLAIRLSLKESGCTGFKYVIDEVAQDQIAEHQQSDIAKQLANGVNLYIATANIGSLRGLRIDYVQQGLNKNLVMENPNVKDACGCGESFSFEEARS